MVAVSREGIAMLQTQGVKKVRGIIDHVNVAIELLRVVLTAARDQD